MNVLGAIKEWLLDSQSLYFDRIIKISKKATESPKKTIKHIVNVRRRNRLAPKRNIWILGTIGENTKIYHQNVVINSHAVVGNNVVFHGNNMIGNDAKDISKAPRIGNGVEFGYGASCIGDIEIADGVLIGAHALVTKSILEKNCIVAGIPAKKIGNEKRCLKK